MPTSNKGGATTPPRQRAPKPVTPTRAAPISDVGMETRRPKNAPYGQSLPNSVHPHVATPAEVQRTRNRKDPVVGVAKAVKADVRAVAPVFRLNVGPGGYTGGKPTSKSAVVPTTLAKNTAKSVAKDFTDPTHHKLNLALDIATLLSGGASGVGRVVKADRVLREGQGVRAAGRALKERPLPQEVLPRKLVGDKATGTRRVRVEGGHVQPRHQSPSIPTAAAQHGFDRLSEKVPNAPLVGAKSRARRIIPEEQAVRTQRAITELAPLEHAARKIRGARGSTSAKEAAYSAVGSFGHGPEGVKLLDTDIAKREQRVSVLPAKIEKAKADAERAHANGSRNAAAADRRVLNLQNEMVTQRDRLAAWKAARPFVENPAKHPDLAAALKEGSLTSGKTTASKINRGALKPDTAAAAENRHARIASGARYEKPTDAKLGKPSKALERQRAIVADLEKRHAKGLERAAKNGKPYPDVTVRVAGRDTTVKRDVSLPEAEARLAALDKSYEAAIKHATPMVDPYQGNSNVMDINGKMRTVKQEDQRFRNMKSKKGGSGSRYHEKQKSVSEEVRQLAADKLDRMAAKRPESELAKMIAERDRLRAAINEHKLPGDTVPPLGKITETVKGKPSTKNIPSDLPARNVLSNPINTRVGGALSVARDRLARMEAGAAKRVKPTGLLGAENVKAGPGHFNIPDVETPARGRGARPRSLNPPKGKIHQSTGVLFSTGRNRIGPRVTTADALKEVRHQMQAEDAHLAKSFSAPFDEATFDPRKQVMLNPEGAKIPRYLRSERTPLDLEQSTSREIAAHWAENRKVWEQHVFPASIEDVPEEHRLGLRMVDRKIAESITGIDQYQSALNKGALGSLLDFGNNINRAALIYLNPSYIPKNFAGNLGFLALQQGPFLANNLIRASQKMNRLAPETLRQITAEAGGGAAVELAHEGRGFLAAPLQKIADVQGAGADRLPRIAAWLWEAHRRGYNTEEQIQMLLREPKLRPVLNEVSDGAQQAMVKFSRAPAQWRRVMSRAIFIFPWVEGATRYVGRLALDRPLAARAAQEVRGRIEHVQKQVFGAGKELTGSRIPLGKPYQKYGTTVVRSVNPMSLSPVGQAADVAAAAKNAATGNWEGSSQLFGMTQPLVNAGFEAATGINTYLGRRYPQGTSAVDILKSNLVGDINHPAVPLADVAATALRKPAPLPDVPAAHQPNYIPEHGWLAAAEKAALGSARVGFHVPGTHIDVAGPQVNLPAVQAKGEARRRAQLTPGAKILETSKQMRTESLNAAIKHGYLPHGTKHLPAPLRNAITLKTKRYANYASLGITSGSGTYQRDAWQADVKQLRKFGKITPAQATKALSWGAKASDKDLRNERAMLGRAYYGGAALSDAAKKLGVSYGF